MYSELENKYIGANYYTEGWGVWEHNVENETGNRNEGTGLQFSQ
jgi:hypothetical protein